jgi:hypothetical protein
MNNNNNEIQNLKKQQIIKIGIANSIVKVRDKKKQDLPLQAEEVL